ncbi:MAG TPA: hypothetical protein VHX36_10305 [Candidatus Acidoferrales bacterium]|jgi:hypothetical protein|nr:hypothetical protein [Candidatus Acidoferrales bacterium]
MSRKAICAMSVLALLSLGAAGSARAQDDQFLMPEQSAAKAKQLLQEAIAALGGNTYLNAHNSTCTGRIGQFDHSGELTGFGHFIDYEVPPDKERQENLPKRNIIEVYNGDKGWELDRGGVSEAPQVDLIDFQEGNKKDLDNILRYRIHEKDMIFRYGGGDIVELKQADWVELVDSDNRTIRIAIATATHLPIQKIVDTRDPRTRRKSEEIEYYSNYHPLEGIQTPFQITRERNGIKIFQVFFDKCDYNADLPNSLFTRESLEERWDKIGSKKEKEKTKDKKDKADKADKDDQSDSSDDPDKN